MAAKENQGPEVEKEKTEDVTSDTGYDTPGIPKEFLNVSLQQNVF